MNYPMPPPLLLYLLQQMNKNLESCLQHPEMAMLWKQKAATKTRIPITPAFVSTYSVEAKVRNSTQEKCYLASTHNISLVNLNCFLECPQRLITARAFLIYEPCNSSWMFLFSPVNQAGPDSVDRSQLHGIRELKAKTSQRGRKKEKKKGSGI